jgi:hypothetical protein
MPPGTGIGHGGRQAASRSAGCYGRPPRIGLHRRLRPASEGRVTNGQLSQVEAARLVGCSRDTIARARRSGRFPNARLDNGRWTIPADDLVAAGLCQPPAQTDGQAPVPSSEIPVGSLEPAAVIELTRAETRIAGLEEVVARQDDELRFLRLTIETLAKRGAA